MKRKIAVILCILLVLSACSTLEEINKNDYQRQVSDSENGINEQLTKIDDADEMQSSIDNNIYNIFPHKQGYIWYYEGSNDSEKISMIDNVTKKGAHYILTIKSCREDLTGVEDIEDRISYSTIEITDSQIICDDTVILSKPLISGNTWITDYRIKPSGIMYTATVEIVESSGNIIKTKTIVNTDSNDIEEKYEEITIYEIGVGVISQWRNIAGMDSYMSRLDLKQTYDQPEIPDKWYLSPYEIKLEKSQ